MTRRVRPERGFTMIEFLIVVIIVGILAAIVVFAVGGTKKHGPSRRFSCPAGYALVETQPGDGSVVITCEPSHRRDPTAPR